MASPSSKLKRTTEYSDLPEDAVIPSAPSAGSAPQYSDLPADAVSVASGPTPPISTDPTVMARHALEATGIPGGTSTVLNKVKLPDMEGMESRRTPSGIPAGSTKYTVPQIAPSDPTSRFAAGLAEKLTPDSLGSALTTGKDMAIGMVKQGLPPIQAYESGKDLWENRDVVGEALRHPLTPLPPEMQERQGRRQAAMIGTDYDALMESLGTGNYADVASEFVAAPARAIAGGRVAGKALEIGAPKVIQGTTKLVRKARYPMEEAMTTPREGTTVTPAQIKEAIPEANLTAAELTENPSLRRAQAAAERSFGGATKAKQHFDTARGAVMAKGRGLQERLSPNENTTARGGSMKAEAVSSLARQKAEAQSKFNTIEQAVGDDIIPTEPVNAWATDVRNQISEALKNEPKEYAGPVSRLLQSIENMGKQEANPLEGQIAEATKGLNPEVVKQIRVAEGLPEVAAEAPNQLKWSTIKQIKSDLWDLGHDTTGTIPNRVQALARAATQQLDDVLVSHLRTKGGPQAESLYREANAGWANLQDTFNNPQSQVTKLVKARYPEDVMSAATEAKPSVLAEMRKQGIRVEDLKRQVVEEIQDGGFRRNPDGGYGKYGRDYLEDLLSPEALQELDVIAEGAGSVSKFPTDMPISGVGPWGRVMMHMPGVSSIASRVMMSNWLNKWLTNVPKGAGEVLRPTPQLKGGATKALPPGQTEMPGATQYQGPRGMNRTERRADRMEDAGMVEGLRDEINTQGEGGRPSSKLRRKGGSITEVTEPEGRPRTGIGPGGMLRKGADLLKKGLGRPKQEGQGGGGEPEQINKSRRNFLKKGPVVAAGAAASELVPGAKAAGLSAEDIAKAGKVGETLGKAKAYATDSLYELTNSDNVDMYANQKIDWDHAMEVSNSIDRMIDRLKTPDDVGKVHKVIKKMNDMFEDETVTTEQFIQRVSEEVKAIDPEAAADVLKAPDYVKEMYERVDADVKRIQADPEYQKRQAEFEKQQAENAERWKREREAEEARQKQEQLEKGHRARLQKAAEARDIRIRVLRREDLADDRALRQRIESTPTRGSIADVTNTKLKKKK